MPVIDSSLPELDAFLQNRLKSDRYPTMSEGVHEALRPLVHHEREREKTLYHLKVKLERGGGQAERGELIDGDEVFEELRRMIDERLRYKANKR